MEKIPPEKRWAITAKILETFALLRGEKRVATEMGKGEGIISPVLGAERFQELTNKAWGEEGGMRLYPLFKEMFNIPVDDAIGAAKIVSVVASLAFGDEWEREIVQKSKDKTIVRTTKCPWMNRWKEQEVNHEVMSCYPVHETWVQGGLKAINPKITHKLTKAMPKGDPYCEDIYEFKDE
ncbi:L-2-amino-thiazoline-4-carboxylic acid hydrolase [Candidatus Borrarchaeum sp.]|uniref:L-2-amino-thiazoline-4-carboxylic acid hydrolase n=1 Tax=Candidatus Borrarchaeum sp. TaxID=2846742 RepID=UPI00257EC83F|nr:L-2-amino-thiazoline-4-carboxylic acid hydrolase [Candidatus Borrarchaeum sp.]